MVLKTIFPGCGVRASLMLFLMNSTCVKLVIKYHVWKVKGYHWKLYCMLNYPVYEVVGPFYVGVLFSPMESGWAGGWREIVCPGCISETVRCRKFILGRDIGWGV